MKDDIDVEQMLADILQEEIWREITIATGETKREMDNTILAALVEAVNKSQ